MSRAEHREAAAVGELAARYREDGFLVAPGRLSGDEVAGLRHEAAEICRGRRGEVRGMEPMLDEPDDDAVARRYLCIHFPHKISALMRDTLRHPRIVEVLAEVIGPDVKAMQSMLFVKQAGKPGQAWHQDEWFIPTRDRSLCGAWIALDDATVENGCLWVIPGSHRPGIFWPRRPHGTDEFDEGDETFGFPFDEQAAIPLEVAAGGVAFFNGYLLHRSFRNRAASGFRRALVSHYMSAQSLLPWDWDGRLPATRDNRDVVIVAGTDPYPWLGTEDATYPFLRAEVRGGPDGDPGKKVF